MIDRALVRMAWSMDRTKLLQAIQDAERHLAAADEYIGTQQQIIRKFERAGRSTRAKTARQVLASMERAKRSYIAERERIRRWLAH